MGATKLLGTGKDWRTKMYDQLFIDDPREYALTMIADGLLSEEYLVVALLKWMSHDDVRDCLDANELSPRFEGDDYD